VSKRYAPDRGLAGNLVGRTSYTIDTPRREVTLEIDRDELARARDYVAGHDFARLTEAQMLAIVARGRVLFHWFKAHPYFHNTLNAVVIVFIFVADYLALMWLPGVWLPRGGDAHVLTVLLASAVAGSLHSYLLYTLSSFSLHEAAAHRIAFIGQGRIAKAAQTVAANLCRLAASEPDYYSRDHMIHHAKFGTEDDTEFLNFVSPRRYYLSFLPLAAFINFTDFIAHRPRTYTRSRIISAAFSTAYSGVYLFLTWQAWGPLFALMAMFVFLPHVGFYLDRLRQFTEHNLMPLENKDGSRSFGVGFWGLLVGGGPWGSPCHLEHHLVPSLPWYQQLNLHRFVKKTMTPVQRRQFLVAPVVGFPLMFLRLVRELHAVRSRSRS
jgi:fatty acid desaturase